MTLGQLLPARIEQLHEVIQVQVENGDASRRGVLAWKTVESQVLEGLREALDVDIFACAAQAWCKASELHEYAAGGTHQKDEQAVVFLGNHTFTWEAHPVFTVIVGSVACKPCRLTLALSGEVHGAELLIRGGRIRELCAGECLASVQLSYEGIPLHRELKSKKVTLPGRHRFDPPGLRIF